MASPVEPREDHADGQEAEPEAGPRYTCGGGPKWKCQSFGKCEGCATCTHVWDCEPLMLCDDCGGV